MTKTIVRVISVPGSVRRDLFHRPPDGVDWAFFDASTSLAEGFDYDVDTAWAHLKRGLAPAEIGCYCSHVRAWHAFLADPTADQILVVEDDVYVDWPVTLHLAALDWGAKNIDFIKFFGRYPAKWRIVEWQYPIWDRHVVQYTTRQYGAQLYLLTRKAAERFERQFRQISRPIDVEMERPWATGIPVTGIVPPTAVELSVPSSVMNRRADRNPSRAEWARYYAGRVVEHLRAGAYRSIGRRVRIGDRDLSGPVIDYRNL